MPDQTAFLTFLAAALALNLAPGPDMLYVLGRSLGQGHRAGIVSSLGIFVGCLVHVFAAALGLAAILRSSAIAYDVIRYAGAAYLIYLGIRVLTSKAEAASLDPTLDRDHNLWAIFRQGVITNVLNPKVAMFFLAFLPQFADPARGNVALTIIVLGLIFDLGGTLVNIAVAVLAGRLGDSLRYSPRVARAQRWFTGTVFVGLGLRLGLAGKN
ncbi:MAG: LysE family translocator [Acidobacteriales bacterium]|nr:LysE family translocator [Terriglobales bacterium]